MCQKSGMVTKHQGIPPDKQMMFNRAVQLMDIGIRLTSYSPLMSSYRLGAHVGLRQIMRNLVHNINVRWIVLHFCFYRANYVTISGILETSAVVPVDAASPPPMHSSDTIESSMLLKHSS